MARKQQPRSRRPGSHRRGSGRAWQVWVVVGVILAAGVIGIAVQASRSESENTDVVTPTRELGPRGSEIEGRSDAPVLVEEYADFQCPSCRAFQAAMGPTVRELVADGTIRFAYHYFPFIGDESVRAASAAVCAGDQGRFFEYADLLYARQAPENSGFLTTDRLVGLGGEVGLRGAELEAFSRCVRAGRYEGWVRQQTEAASKRGINATPTVFIDGREAGATELASAAAFRAAIERAASRG
jgi:protein-disulfide isomerase